MSTMFKIATLALSSLAATAIGAGIGEAANSFKRHRQDKAKKRRILEQALCRSGVDYRVVIDKEEHYVDDRLLAMEVAREQAALRPFSQVLVQRLESLQVGADYLTIATIEPTMKEVRRPSQAVLLKRIARLQDKLEKLKAEEPKEPSLLDDSVIDAEFRDKL